MPDLLTAGSGWTGRHDSRNAALYRHAHLLLAILGSAASMPGKL